ncbi:hypothetical protein F8M41_019048 [Gigaspora margarita]|uniref:Uncharacterized protein n=1 Tax=Gigaspora margarita TaxID=4874 RepID=A0A8H4EKY8_GIGMA|nr:hypothetical protein F8M41_019048 [Gigaspora margarita]
MSTLEIQNVNVGNQNVNVGNQNVNVGNQNVNVIMTKALLLEFESINGLSKNMEEEEEEEEEEEKSTKGDNSEEQELPKKKEKKIFESTKDGNKITFEFRN